MRKHPLFLSFCFSFAHQKQLTHQKRRRLCALRLCHTSAAKAIYMIIRNTVDGKDSHKQEKAPYKIALPGVIEQLQLAFLFEALYIGITS